MTRLVVVPVAFGAACLAAMSGGSASLITTPTWIALGVPYPTAVGADKIAGLCWTAVAARSFLPRGAVDRRLVTGMGAAGLVGAALGAVGATVLDQGLLRRGAGIAILAVLLASLLVPVGRDAGPRLGRAATGLLALPLGMYEGVLGSGNGILTSLLLQRIRRWDLPTALGHYYVLAALWCGLAGAVFLARGVLDAGLTAGVTVGAVAGAAVGARLARGSTRRLLRPLFYLSGFLLAGRLALGG